MRVEQFPMCCGALIFSDFGNTNESLGTKDYISVDSIKKEVEKALKGREGKAFIFVVLNEDQRSVLGKMFEELGFKIATEGFTADYGYPLTLYAFVNDVNNPHTNRTDYEYEDDDENFIPMENCNCDRCLESRGE